MSIPTALAIYFIFWWITLFAVLPFGVRSQHEAGNFTPGTDPGAPVLTNLKRKLAWTTVVSGLAFAVFYVVYTYRLVTLDQFSSWPGMPR
jgi:predicted secreted protein